jgi:ankyrin repeat protein
LNGYAETCKLLIDNGVDAEAKNKDGKTALHLASLNGNVKAADLIIGKSGNIANEQDNAGKTALFYAAKKGHTGMCKFLVSKGADPKIKDNDGKTALDEAEGHGETKAFLESI